MLPIKIKLVNLGRVEREFREIIGEYERRLKSMAHLRFSTKISPEAILIDEYGEEMSTEQFQSLLMDYSKNGKEIEFAIGPPEGFLEEMKMKHRKISLSRLTLRHEIAYLVLLEQIYRVLLRLRGTKYEK